MPLDAADRVLTRAHIAHEPHWSESDHTVYLTRGNQLIGCHAALGVFRDRTPEYKGWHSHHIVEEQDLERLGIAAAMPPRDRQVCVLLPERGHVGRINSRLRTVVPLGTIPTAEELIDAYEDAYWVLGNYCGGGSLRVRDELVAIVQSVFDHGMS